MTRDRSLETSVLLQDIIVVLAAMLLARGAHAALVGVVPTLKPPVAAGEYAHLLLVFLPTWMFAADRLGIHRVETVTGEKLEVVRRVILTQAWGVASIGLILTFAQVSLNRSLILVFLAVSTVMLLVLKAAQAPWLARRRGQSRVLVIGDPTSEVAGEFERLRGRRVERWTGGDTAALEARFRAGGVDEVVLVGQLPPDRMLAYAGACAEAGLPILLPLPREPHALPLPPPDVETVGNSDYVVYQPRKLEAGVIAAKAIVDRVLAAVFIVLFSPIMLLVAIAVRVGVGSPVLYVQRRGGLYGHPFPMLKFRTMRMGADQQRAALEARNEMDGPVFKMRDDPRVTPLGRILRRSSLDELPQLFNVLAGQMSIVGPRPLPVEETAALTGRHRRRLSIRPGLTCLWQVSGRSDLTFAEWMALDLEYVDRWTLWLDLAILLRTIPALVSRRGAR
jgi:exopolysaccharide biosynthesis polyprenyl glycosylphosphotransferase